jgi:carboxypeptidase C (cathepsin A)
MNKHARFSALLSLCLMLHCAVVPVLADEPPSNATPSSNDGTPAASVTEHSIRVNGNVLDYVAEAGLQPLRDEAGHVQAEIFFVAYTKKGVEDVAGRPMTFVFNGGPGSSSMWLHMGAVGPQRVQMADPRHPSGWQTSITGSM